jgi:succinyl-diaminopimelate desuccinylase
MGTVELLKLLVSIPSQLGHTWEMENFAAGRLEKLAEPEFVKVGKKGRDVLASVIHDKNFPTVVINCHLDTVEVCQGWTRDPFKPIIEKDKLYGLGSADMKAGIAIGLETFEMLAKLGTVNATFAGTIDEEGVSEGAFKLLAKKLKGDICLIPEPSCEALTLGCRGRLVFDVEVRGASAHGARPDEGVNAIVEASRFVSALGKLRIAKHDVLGEGSLCVLAMSGGTNTLSVPDTCKIILDRHYVPGETEASITGSLKEIAEGLNCRADFEIRLAERETPFLEPYITEPTGLVGGFISAVKSHASYGKSVGDYNVFAKMMPTVVYGPVGGNWHGADEWVSVSSVKRCLEGYGRFAARLKEQL